MQLDFTALQKASISLDEAVINACNSDFIDGLTMSQRKLVVAGVIQNFEFTYELSWKFIKRWLSENIGRTSVDGVSRRELFRLAAEYQLIDDVNEWMFFHQARNQTSHTYDENVANEVFDVAKRFSSVASHLLNVLQQKND